MTFAMRIGDLVNALADDLGRDLFSLIVADARTSISAGFAVALLAAASGTRVGVSAGFLGGWTDDLLMRATEVVQVVPRFCVVILVAALFGASLHNLILALGLTVCPWLARIVTGLVIALVVVGIALLVDGCRSG